MKIIDAQMYVDSCKVLEQIENQKILLYISEWLNQIKKDIENEILPYYTRPNDITEIEDTFIPQNLTQKCDAFKEIIENFQYIPIQPPFFTLKTTVEQIIQTKIPDELKMRNIIFKNIPEFNFTESLLIQPNYKKTVQSDINNSVGSIPIVHSMTVTYHYNPLMWPLIFHEYGHSAFHEIFSKPEVQKAIRTIKQARLDLSLKADVDEETLLVCISEVYSDLFALNYYSNNYFFAFYFHEMLCSDINHLYNLDAVGMYKNFQDHPPSIIRLDYLYKEMRKKKMVNDEVVKKINEYNDYLKSIHSENIKKIGKPYRNLYDVIYGEMSSLFNNNVPHKFNQKQINEMCDLLREKLPIGTMYKTKGIKLKIAMQKKDKFDLEKDNNIIDIIYAGWKFVILSLIDEIYSNASEEQIERFSKDYSFFIKNISYSIETSVIVSGYLRDKNAN
jgi:hypothetical protein